MTTLADFFWPGIAILALLLTAYLFTRKGNPNPKLSFLIYKNKKQMQPVSSLTLKSLVALLVPFAIVDANNGNQPIPGTYSNEAITSTDPTQDTASIPDPSQQNALLDAITPQGGTTVNLSVQFSSTKMQPDGVTPVVSGTFTATLTLVNNVVVSAVLAFLQ